MNDLQGKTMLVTGATAGIGFETALALARAGARVFVHGRSEARAKAAIVRLQALAAEATLVPVWGDFASLGEVRALAAQILEQAETLEVLLNNAGGIFSPRQQSRDGFELTFAVNHLAPFLLTRLLLDRLKASAPSRIVTVASMAHKRATFDLDDLQARRRFSLFGTYGASKLMNILFTRELSRRLAGTQVTANCLHPGVVWTRFGRDGDAGGLFHRVMGLARPFLLTPEKGARTSIHLAASPQVEGVSGEYFIRCKIARPTALARDDTMASELWRRSEALLA